jgi:hypothetical protein
MTNTSYKFEIINNLKGIDENITLDASQLLGYFGGSPEQNAEAIKNWCLEQHVNIQISRYLSPLIFSCFCLLTAKYLYRVLKDDLKIVIDLKFKKYTITKYEIISDLLYLALIFQLAPILIWIFEHRLGWIIPEWL